MIHPPRPDPSFTAVLLAGGKSRRMGRDKAALVIANQPLWQHQLATLRISGADEILISGRSDGPYATAGVPVIADEQPGLGPLAGLVSSLRRAQHEWVLALAIDLPLMTAVFLRRLVENAETTQRGVLPRSAAGWEPLAAVYPRACLQLAEACLENRELSLQHFARVAEAAGLLEAHPVTTAESHLFLNVNTEEDLLRLRS